MRTILLDDIAPQPWRNGNGRTRELLAWPPRVPDWQLRVSVADVEADAPFSAFPGIERWFAVVEGAGVELVIDGVVHRLGPAAAPLRFAGDAAVQCRLVDGPTRDLNLMLRGGGRGAMQRLSPGRPWAPPAGAAQCGVFSAVVAKGTAGGDGIEWPAMSLLWFDPAPAGLVVRVSSAAAWGLHHTPRGPSR